jgi:hypothetical protein
LFLLYDGSELTSETKPMLSSFATLFCKRADCPASHTLLDYCRSLMSAREIPHIKIHLASCDFCGAELQLLGRYHDEPEQYSFAEMPLHLRRLAEDLLQESTTAITTFPELGQPREFSR